MRMNALLLICFILSTLPINSFAIDDDDKAETMSEINTKDMVPYAGKYVKVVVVNKTNPYLFDKFMNNLYKDSEAVQIIGNTVLLI